MYEERSCSVECVRVLRYGWGCGAAKTEAAMS